MIFRITHYKIRDLFLEGLWQILLRMCFLQPRSMELSNFKCWELKQHGAFLSIHIILKLRISLFIPALNAIDQFDFLEQKLRLFEKGAITYKLYF